MNLFHYKQDSIADAAASILEASYSIKTSTVQSLMDKFTSLDAVELEDFLKAASAYFAEEGDSGVFDDLSILFDKAAKRWQNREGN